MSYISYALKRREYDILEVKNALIKACVLCYGVNYL